MDVTLVGKDGVTVRASKYVLACRCQSLENKLYTPATCTTQQEQQQVVHMGDYTEIALQALVEYCFTGELLSFWKLHESLSHKTAVHYITELATLAHDYCFSPLEMQVYQLARRLMNQHPTTACLFYNTGQRDVQHYARQTLQECPREALFSTNVTCLTPERLETLLSTHDGLENLGEIKKVQLLQVWSEGNNVQVARQCAAKYIDLSKIRLDQENVTTLKHSGLFHDDDIPQATVCITDDECNVERVVVEGAGMDSVNGVYYRELDEEEVHEEVMYVYGNMTLYCWNDTWHIAPTCDLSNSLYQCSASGTLVPTNKWQSVGGTSPAPRCTWMPGSTSEEDATSEEELVSE